MNMIQQIQEAEAAVLKLNQKYFELTMFMLMAEDGMKNSVDEPEYLSFWSKHDRFSKQRREVGLKRLTANAYLSVKKAEAKVVGFFS